MTIDEFLDKIDGKAQRAGSGWLVCCPGHEDSEPSLSVGEGEDGRILLNCQARQCKPADIVAAMGLTITDLFPTAKRRDDREPSAIYTYRDEQGAVLYEQLRFEPKSFRQRHYDPANPDAKPDGYVYSLDGVRRVPYRLPEMLAGIAEGRGVWLFEGEKDVDNARAAWDVVATSLKNWRPEWSIWLQGVPVTIVQDRDDAGRTQALKVREMIEPVSSAMRVLQSKVGKDASDHLAAGLGLADFLPIRQGPRRGIVTAQQMVESARESLFQSEHDTPGYPMLPGLPIVFRPGRMYALGAYQSDGKTRMALQITRHLCSMGLHGGYRSLEMPEKDLRNILLSHRGVPFAMLENSPWEIRQHPEILALFEAALAEMFEWKLDIAFNSKVTSEEIVNEAIEREHDFVVIDHVHRLNWGGERRGLESAVQALTNLALEQNIPVLMLCQLRKVSRGKDMIAFPNPTIQEFRETSVIADDASMALSLWRQRDNNGIRFTGGTNLTILKNRHTTSRSDAAGTIFLPTFESKTQTFTFNSGGITHGDTGRSTADAEFAGEPEHDEPDAFAEEWGGLYD